ncbi:hypothetical protein KIN20_029075 [Parelaphostrongylus tenuis]|uniref:Uncharacterized protein n=1 Tax=Parelaphostrongylus tenuis TaxID=148309 RepID=A0AAD5R2K6_PARTN|nr:hypothetical protein KIN20_029075 [Parelaphostrongylus tenuis]
MRETALSRKAIDGQLSEAHLIHPTSSEWPRMIANEKVYEITGSFVNKPCDFFPPTYSLHSSTFGCEGIKLGLGTKNRGLIIIGPHITTHLRQLLQKLFDHGLVHLPSANS